MCERRTFVANFLRFGPGSFLFCFRVMFLGLFLHFHLASCFRLRPKKTLSSRHMKCLGFGRTMHRVTISSPSASCSFKVDPSKILSPSLVFYPRLLWFCFRISSCCCSTRSTLYFTKRGAVFESTIQRLNGRTNSSFSMDPDRSASILGCGHTTLNAYQNANV